MKVTEAFVGIDSGEITDPQFQMESAVTAPVSGHIKRVVVQEGAHL
jgi:biotin carboxyl carrier protein